MKEIIHKITDRLSVGWEAGSPVVFSDMDEVFEVWEKDLPAVLLALETIIDAQSLVEAQKRAAAGVGDQ